MRARLWEWGEEERVFQMKLRAAREFRDRKRSEREAAKERARKEEGGKEEEEEEGGGGKKEEEREEEEVVRDREQLLEEGGERKGKEEEIEEEEEEEREEETLNKGKRFGAEREERKGREKDEGEEEKVRVKEEEEEVAVKEKKQFSEEGMLVGGEEERRRGRGEQAEGVRKAGQEAVVREVLLEMGLGVEWNGDKEDGRVPPLYQGLRLLPAQPDARTGSGSAKFAPNMGEAAFERDVALLKSKSSLDPPGVK